MDVRPLAYPQFRRLYLAQVVSFLGTMLTYVALPYEMYQITGSSLNVGLLGLAELGPLLATAFIGGALADSFDRRRMILITDVGLALGSGTLAVLAATGTTTPWALYVVAGAMSAVTGLQRPSMDALVPRLVPRELITAAVGLGMLRGSVGQIAGPAIGGLILASGGVATTFALDALTYVVALGLVLRMAPVPPSPTAEKPSLAGVIEGFRYARSRQELIGTYVVDIVAMVFGMPLALFPALSVRFGGATALGALYAAPAVGALLASLTTRWARRVHRHGLGVLLAAMAWGLAIVAFGLSTTLPVAVAWLVAAGAADGLSAIYRMTIWNETIPDAMRGRLASIEMVSYSSGPLLGHVEAGLVAGWVGTTAAVVSGGVLCVVGVLVCGALLPRFVGYDARAFPHPPRPAEG